MSNGSRIVCASRPDTTPEDKLSVLANVYEFILRCAEEKRKADSAHTGHNTLSLYEENERK